MNEENMLNETDLEQLGFEDNRLETKGHVIHIVFYDIWHLSITGKPDYSNDSIYMSGYWNKDGFVELIKVITGKNLLE